MGINYAPPPEYDHHRVCNPEIQNIKVRISEMEFKEFEPRFKSAKTRFKLSAGLNLETFDTILSGTNHI